MSQCDVYCEHEHDDHGHLISSRPYMWITRPSFKYYIARVRRPYEKRYTILGKSRSRRKAYRMLADAMQDFQWKRGDVLADEGPGSYYEPSLLVEMTR